MTNFENEETMEPVFSHRDHEKRHWHIDRSISLSDLITLLSTAVLVVAFYFGLDKRIDREKERAEMYVAVQHERDQRQDESIRDSSQDIKVQLNEIKQALLRLDTKVDQTALHAKGSQ